MRGAARRSAGWMTVVIATVVVSVGPATPAPAAPATRDDVYEALGIDNVPDDYVVMVDVSGSIGGRYTQVKGALRAFFAALAPQDQVTLIPFADSAKSTTVAAGRAPDKLIAALPARAASASHW